MVHIVRQQLKMYSVVQRESFGQLRYKVVAMGLQQGCEAILDFSDDGRMDYFFRRMPPETI